MPRPFKCRRICFAPEISYFKPAGVPGKNLEEIVLTLDELEAIRLADSEGLYQETAAQKMNISRQTFGNIISSAHAKVADCLINGKALKIIGGTITMVQERNFTCSDCRHEWSVPFGTGRPQQCPSCKGSNIHRSENDRGYFGGRGGKHGCEHGRHGRRTVNMNTPKKGEHTNENLHTGGK